MPQDKDKSGERAVLVGVELPGDSHKDTGESMSELEKLAGTAGAAVVGRLMQKKARPDPATFLGRGKVREVARMCGEVEADLVICDREITPAQTRNLEKAIGVRVIDRSLLILDIFAGRAKTSEGKLQVELAQLNYMLPRLSGIGADLSRLGGGIGTRGPGETRLEVDRRRIRKRISDLKRDIEEVRRHREVLRKGRREIPVVQVSIVGYTNSGKSTLLRALTGADVLVEDKLFATLDPTTRKVTLPNNETVLLTDTVGFISNLPHHLVAAFRATLEEVVEADILLHVIDISHPGFIGQAGTVREVLDSLGAGDKPTIPVFNKVDRIRGDCFPPLELGGDPVCISALTGSGLDKLLDRIAAAAARRRVRRKFFLPFSKAGLLPVIFGKGKVLRQEHGPDGIMVEAELEEIWAGRLDSILKRD
ncbi:MAG: GTPase HflX [Bacillota bacterium]